MPIGDDVQLGRGVVIRHPELVNLYGCSIGDETKIGSFVEIQADVRVGSHCKISSHSFLCTGVEIEDEAFIGHGVMFTNELHPRKRGIGKLAVRFRQDPGDLGDIYGTPEQRDNAHSVGT